MLYFTFGNANIDGHISSLDSLFVVSAVHLLSIQRASVV